MKYSLRIISYSNFSNDPQTIALNFIGKLGTDVEYSILESGDYYKLEHHKVVSFWISCEIIYDLILNTIGTDYIFNNGHFAIFDTSKGSVVRVENAYWVCIEILEE